MPTRAHAPIAQGAALTPDAGSTAIAMPGFGILYRAAGSASFAYICDALLDDQPTDIVPYLTFLADGTLLMSSIDGVRRIDQSGCPQEGGAGELASATVFALAAHASTQTAYAVVADDKAGLWRSDDGGRSWTLRAPLGDAVRVTGLFVSDDDPMTVYSSSTDAMNDTSILRESHDGGATSTSVSQDRALTLLHVPNTASPKFWAYAPSADNVTNRGFDLLSADTLAGPWTSPLKLNYFGGFVVAPDGTLWAGDEGGGVYQSTDGGATFVAVAAKEAVSCLDFAGDTLWACKQTLTTQPAFVTRDAGSGSFDGVVAFADVDHMVSCESVDVSTRCAAAWFEWRRDVRLEVITPDAGAPTLDAGMSASVDAGIGTGDAAVAPLDASFDSQGGKPTADKDGCSVSGGARPLSGALWTGLALVLQRRRRRAR